MSEQKSLEEMLKEAEKPLLKSEILRAIDTLDFKALNAILDKLEENGKVVVGGKGVLWTYNESKKFNDLLNSSVVHND